MRLDAGGIDPDARCPNALRAETAALAAAAKQLAQDDVSGCRPEVHGIGEQRFILRDRVETGEVPVWPGGGEQLALPLLERVPQAAAADNLELACGVGEDEQRGADSGDVQPIDRRAEVRHG